jgi:hypothetical protein
MDDDESWTMLGRRTREAVEQRRAVVGYSVRREPDDISFYVGVKADDVEAAVNVAASAAGDALRSMSLLTGLHMSARRVRAE